MSSALAFDSAATRTALRDASTAQLAAAPALASTGIADLLRGPLRPASVISIFPTAIYLRAEPLLYPDRHNADSSLRRQSGVIAILTNDASRLPLGAILHRPATHRPLISSHGALDAFVGEGRITVGQLTVRASGWWDPRPRLPAIAPALLPEGMRELRAAVSERLHGPVRDVPVELCGQLGALRAALRRNDVTAALRASQRMIGLGPGLTPAGDDLLCGMLAGLTLLGHPQAGRIGAGILALAPGRTTDLSLALLRHATLGQVNSELGTVIQALAGTGRLHGALERLFAVGHTSGIALGLGLSAAVDLTSRTIRSRG
ncbi:MAG: DUF2877 domain-containing protein [Geodermatophilaceae bacterium]|nr:DUF2877 domain-containing protein [Geodermatophilaceae bacterium]